MIVLGGGQAATSGSAGADGFNIVAPDLEAGRGPGRHDDEQRRRPPPLAADAEVAVRLLRAKTSTARAASVGNLRAARRVPRRVTGHRRAARTGARGFVAETGDEISGQVTLGDERLGDDDVRAADRRLGTRCEVGAAEPASIARA